MNLPEPYYEDDAVALYHGDCREVLRSTDAVGVGVVVADPPYGIEHESGHESPWSQIHGDGDKRSRQWILAGAHLVPTAMFDSPKNPIPDHARGTLIWDKGPQHGMGDLKFPWKPSWEYIHIFGDGWSGHRDEGVLKGFDVVSWASRGRTHPNEKPVGLMEHLITKAPDGRVLDPFAGTGAAVIAAKNLGRKAIGIEIEERYCEIAAERLSQGVLPLEAS